MYFAVFATPTCSLPSKNKTNNKDNTYSMRRKQMRATSYLKKMNLPTFQSIISFTCHRHLEKWSRKDIKTYIVNCKIIKIYIFQPCRGKACRRGFRHKPGCIWPQKMTSGLNFLDLEVEIFYYLCSENKGADQLRDYVTFF